MGHILGHLGKYLILRSTTWHYHRKVPKDVAHLDKRKKVKKSLKTDSIKTAMKRASIINEATEQYWNALRLQRTDNKKDQYEAAVKTAQYFGFEYKTIGEIIDDNSDVIQRMQKIEEIGVTKNPSVEALAGLVDRPDYCLSNALEDYWEYSRDVTRRMGDREERRWRRPRERAFENFIDLKSDLPLDKITRNDALDFREWWLDRILDEKLTANAANKDIRHLSKIFSTINDAKRLNLINPFREMALSEVGDESFRQPFDPKYIEDVLINSDALAGMNFEGRMLVFAMADTGAGFSELVNLLPEEINLATPIPYIEIKDNVVRKLKTKYRPRKIPLVGSALFAFHAMPDGFQKYRDKSDSASSMVNKYLRENNLCPTSDHSAYSLRHSFSDRMLAAEFPDRIQKDLMGHKLADDRPKYGKGGYLEHVHSLLQKIAFTVKARK